MNNKKGISAIVATVLIILITVAAVTIIWAAIIPMITENLAGTECFDASAALTIVSDYTCYIFNSTDNKTNVQVHRSAGDSKLVGLDVVIGSQGSTISFPQTTVPSLNGEKVYPIDLKLNFTTAPETVSVAAKVQSGNTQKPCSVGSAVTLVKCA